MHSSLKTILFFVVVVATGIVVFGGQFPASRTGAPATLAIRTPGLATLKVAMRHETAVLRATTGNVSKDKNKRVLVMCYAPTELKWDNDACDSELAFCVADCLSANGINVIRQDRVQAWMARNLTNGSYTPVEAGKVFAVDFVVNIDLSKYTLFENHSVDLYRGQSDATISVIRMDNDKRSGTSIYDKKVALQFPSVGPVSAYDIAYDDFKKRFLTSLSKKIGDLLVEWYNGNDE